MKKYQTEQSIYSFEGFELPELNDKDGYFDSNKCLKAMEYEQNHEDAHYYNEYLKSFNFIGNVSAKVNLKESKNSPEILYVITLCEKNEEDFKKDFNKILADMIGYDNFWKERLTFEQACEQVGIDEYAQKIINNYKEI